jgi:hypothetical protein
MLESADPLRNHARLIDFRQLGLFFGMGRIDFITILGDVIHDVPEHLEKIHSAILCGEEKEMKFRAHRMRGMLANVGCCSMMAVLHDLEFLEPPPRANADAIHLNLEGLWRKSLVEIRIWAQSDPGFLS